MWTPAIERDRRIALQDRSTRFFGTDFSFEDLEERDVDQYDYALLGEETVDGAPCWKIQSMPKQTQVVAVHAIDRLDPQGQLRVRADRELRQGPGGAPAELQRHPERAGHLDRPAARDDRSAPRQPHAADARQAAVQRAAEGRGLHAAGASAGSERRAARSPLRAGRVSLGPGVGLDRRAHRPLTHRGFVEARGVLFPQDAPNDRQNARRRPAGARGSVRRSRRRGFSSPAASTCARTRTIRSSDSWRARLRGSRRCGGRVCRSAGSTATLTRGPIHASTSASSSSAGARPTSSRRPTASRRATS